MPPAKPRRYRGATIRPVPALSGTRYEADISVHGERRRARFENIERAKQYIEETRARADAGIARLTVEQERDAVEAYRLLQGAASLADAARFFASRRAEVRGMISAGEAVQAYLTDKAVQGASERHAQTMRTHLARFVANYADVPVVELDSDIIRRWLDRLNVGRTTWNNYRRTLSGFFRWALQQGYVDQDPIKRIPAARQERTLPDILTPDQFARLLRAADPRIRAHFALGGFAGLRSGEIAKLRWEDITATHVNVGPHAAKTRQQRRVDVRPALTAWLATCERVGEDLRPPNARKLFDRAVQDAKLEPWPNNCLRHSYGTYLLALTDNGPHVAGQMGHTSMQMLYNHYRRPVNAEQAAAWFEVMP